MNAPKRGYKICPESTTNRTEEQRWACYRATPSMWESLVEKQGGVCAMCFENEPTEIDHYHAPGTNPTHPRDPSLIRGAVCRRCNYVLGKYESNIRPPLNAPHLIWLVETYLEKERPFA